MPSRPDEPERRRRVGFAVTRYRQQHHLNWHQLWKRGGPAIKTQKRIEKGQAYRPSSLQKLAEAGGWTYSSRHPVEDGLEVDLRPKHLPGNPPSDVDPAEADQAKIYRLPVSLNQRLPADVQRSFLIAAARLVQRDLDAMTREWQASRDEGD